MAAENYRCQIKNTEFDLPKTEVLTLPGQGQFAAEPERRICRRGTGCGRFYRIEPPVCRLTATFARIGSACRQESGMRICRRDRLRAIFSRAGPPKAIMSSQPVFGGSQGGQTDTQPVPGGKRQERSGRHKQDTA